MRKRLAQASPPLAAQSIGTYTSVSKTSALHDPSAGKGLVVAADAVATRKRKAASIEVQIPSRLATRTISFPPSSDDEANTAPPKRPCRRPDFRASSVASVKPTPKGKRVAKAVPSRTKTVHKPSLSTVIAKSRRQGRTSQSKIDGVLESKKLAHNKGDSIDESLPPHLSDLVRLNKAFLKTVALHIAHVGSNVPIDVCTIAPNLSRTWGKRQVTVEDIRRCIAIQAYSPKQDASPTFVISDYGRGKMCIELAPGASVNEERLIRQFRKNLGAFCAERALEDMADVGATLEGLTLDDLPKATITDMGAAAKASPMLIKGQRALSKLKSGREAKQQEKEAKKQALVNNPMLNPDGTKMSLLDRLRLKQLAKANEPLGPAGPELQRQAALNRVADVAATISMLSLSNPLSLPRQAFTMMAILEKLRDSLRVPISKEEGIACIRLIAAEVAPEWLRVVTIGGRENVVVQRNGQPVDRVIRERVQRLLT